MRKPPSAVNGWVNTAAGLGAVAALLFVSERDFHPLNSLLICVLAIVLPVATVDLVWRRVDKRWSAGLGRRTPATGALPRVITKLLGLWLTLGVVAFAYWLFPEYNGDFYTPFFTLVRGLLPWFLILSVAYFWYVDRRMDDPHDGYWHLGRMFLARWPDSREARAKLREHALGWTIKAFFLPLMTVYLHRNLNWFAGNPASEALATFNTAVHWWISLGFFLDVAFATVGYLLTLRIFDSHIRSSNPLLLGWGVAIMCYQPFWSLFERHYLGYGNVPDWQGWLGASPALQTLWGSALIVLILFYAWATVIFGLRFSNLTHRGIITNGPYSLTKHPAYISKNLYWWLMAVPFISNDGWDVAVKSCLLLALINVVYFLRARTEERHLSEDSVYIEYAMWINEHGLFRKLGRILPFLRYIPGQARAEAIAVPDSR